MNMHISDLAAEIKRQKALKKDFIATAWDGFRMNPEANQLEIEGKDEFFIRDYAHGDLASFTEIPKAYYDRMRRQMPELLSTNVNHWLEAKKEPRLIRTLANEVRCVRSNSFRPLDHDQLIEATLPALYEHRDIQIKECHLTEKKLYLKAILPRLEFEVRKGDIVQFGLTVSNSEIGQGALEVAIFAFRLICLNGAVLPDGKQRKSHVGGRLGDELVAEYLADETRKVIDNAFFLKLRDTTRHMLSEAACQGAMIQMQRAAGEKLEARPDKVVQELAKRTGLNEDEGTSVLEFLLTGGDMTRWGLANAVTALARNKRDDDADRSDELQRLGGKIISLEQREWSQVAEAA